MSSGRSRFVAVALVLFVTERYPIDFEHLGERYGLLTIIVLGESFVKVLGALVSEGDGVSLYLDAGAVLLITCGVWWVYFDDVAGFAPFSFYAFPRGEVGYFPLNAVPQRFRSFFEEPAT